MCLLHACSGVQLSVAAFLFGDPLCGTDHLARLLLGLLGPGKDRPHSAGSAGAQIPRQRCCAACPFSKASQMCAYSPDGCPVLMSSPKIGPEGGFFQNVQPGVLSSPCRNQNTPQAAFCNKGLPVIWSDSVWMQGGRVSLLLSSQLCLLQSWLLLPVPDSCSPHTFQPLKLRDGIYLTIPV